MDCKGYTKVLGLIGFTSLLAIGCGSSSNNENQNNNGMMGDGEIEVVDTGNTGESPFNTSPAPGLSSTTTVLSLFPTSGEIFTLETDSDLMPNVTNVLSGVNSGSNIVGTTAEASVIPTDATTVTVRKGGTNTILTLVGGDMIDYGAPGLAHIACGTNSLLYPINGGGGEGEVMIVRTASTPTFANVTIDGTNNITPVGNPVCFDGKVVFAFNNGATTGLAAVDLATATVAFVDATLFGTPTAFQIDISKEFSAGATPSLNMLTTSRGGGFDTIEHRLADNTGGFAVGAATTLAAYDITVRTVAELHASDFDHAYFGATAVDGVGANTSALVLLRSNVTTLEVDTGALPLTYRNMLFASSGHFMATRLDDGDVVKFVNVPLATETPAVVDALADRAFTFHAPLINAAGRCVGSAVIGLESLADPTLTMVANVSPLDDSGLAQLTQALVCSNINDAEVLPASAHFNSAGDLQPTILIVCEVGANLENLLVISTPPATL